MQINHKVIGPTMFSPLPPAPSLCITKAAAASGPCSFQLSLIVSLRKAQGKEQWCGNAYFSSKDSMAMRQQYVTFSD